MASLNLMLADNPLLAKRGTMPFRRLTELEKAVAKKWPKLSRDQAVDAAATLAKHLAAKIANGADIMTFEECLNGDIKMSGLTLVDGNGQSL